MNDEDKAKLLAIKKYAEENVIEGDKRPGHASGFAVNLGPYNVVFTIRNYGHHRGKVRHMTMATTRRLGDHTWEEVAKFFFACGSILGFSKTDGQVEVWDVPNENFSRVTHATQTIPGTRGN